MEATQLVKFEPSLLAKYGADIVEQIATKSDEYAQLTFDDANYDASAKILRTVVTTRTGIEARRKELKAPIIEDGRNVDDAAKYLTGLLLPLERTLQAGKDAADKIEADRKAAEKAAKESRLRAELEARIKAEREAEEERLRHDREAEEQRLADERAAFEAEKAKAVEAKRIRDEAERIEREVREAEQRRVAAEQATQAAELKRQQDAITEASRKAAEERHIADEKAATERKAAADKVAAEQAAAQAELDRRQRDIEAAEQRVREAKEAAYREESARLAGVAAERLAAQILLGESIDVEPTTEIDLGLQDESEELCDDPAEDSDEVKISCWAEDIRQLAENPPDVVSDDAKAEVLEALLVLNKLADELFAFRH